MTIKQLKKGTYFKVVDKNGHVGTCVYARMVEQWGNYLLTLKD